MTSRWHLITLFCLIVLSTTSSGFCQVSWGSSILKMDAEWYSGAEAIRIADNLLLYQHQSGGWPKNEDMARKLSDEDAERILKEKSEQDTKRSTIDNGASYTQMRYLALVYESTQIIRFKESFLRGVDYLLEAQYENGGWPQYYPRREGYYERITLNDGAMVGVLSLLKDAVSGESPFTFMDAERGALLEAALARGIENILQMQIRQDGELTAWCAQHDQNTLEPAWARAYEPPSISGGETVGIIRFLMSIDDPSPEIVAAVEGAVRWLKSVAIYGLRYESFTDENGKKDKRVVPDAEAGPLWARFYELESNRPIFLGRDSVTRYSLEEIEQERRGGYSYYGSWAKNLIAKEYPVWKKSI